MKRSSYDKGWGNILVAIAMVGFGFLYEPLLMILGLLILVTATIASIVESRARKYEELEFRKAYSEQAEQSVTVA